MLNDEWRQLGRTGKEEESLFVCMLDQVALESNLAATQYMVFFTALLDLIMNDIIRINTPSLLSEVGHGRNVDDLYIHTVQYMHA